MDTGSDLSVLPASFRKNGTVASPFQLFAANGSIIHTYGQKLLSIDFGFRRPLQWIFTVADVTKPIIGADFLQHFAILVDIKKKQLIDSLTSFTSAGTIYRGPSTQISTINSGSTFDNILQDFRDITKPSNSFKPVKHSITHHIS